SSSLVFTTFLGTKTPALLNRMSSRPNALTVSLTIRSTSAPTRTSTDTDLATPPAFSISAAVLAADSARTSASISFAPSCANRIALARPIPEPAPVINATLSLSSMPSHLCLLCRSSMTDACHTWRTFGSAPRSGASPTTVRARDAAARLAYARDRRPPDRKNTLVGKIRQMAFDCRVVAVGFAAGQDMNRQDREGQVDEHGSPSDFRRVDSEQHRDSEDHDSRIERRTKQRARPQSGKRTRRLRRAAIKHRVEPLENRNRDRADEIPSQVVADRHAEVRPRRIVPEHFAEEPSVAEHAQWIDHQVHHHHEQRRHQPYPRRTANLPCVENPKISTPPIQRRTEQQRERIAGESQEGERQRIHERNAEHPNLAPAGRVNIVIQPEREPVVNRRPLARERGGVGQDRKQDRRAQPEVHYRDKQKTRQKDEHVRAQHDRGQ